MNLLFALLLGIFGLTSCQKESVSPGEPPVNPTQYKNLKYLALGDSYTIGQSVALEDRWPLQLAEKLKEKEVYVDSTQIIAKTGWTTGNLQAALQVNELRERYDLVSLLIGVNNQYQGRSLGEYQQQFTALLEQSIDLAGGDSSRVFVLSIPDYGYTPFGAGDQARISAEIDLFNQACRDITLSYGIAYYDITEISRRGLDEPDLVASDGLHPSGKQYSEWVEQIYRHVALQVRAE